MVSQGSTASSLAIPHDNVFRFVPTDHVEGKASSSSGTSNGRPKWVRTGLSEPAADPTSPATLTSDGCPLT